MTLNQKVCPNKTCSLYKTKLCTHKFCTQCGTKLINFLAYDSKCECGECLEECYVFCSGCGKAVTEDVEREDPYDDPYRDHVRKEMSKIKSDNQAE